MFTYLKRRRAELAARTKIGIELKRQIKEAFDQNELETSTRLMTFFTAGYIYGFVRIGFFTLTGVSGEEATDKHIRRICDGVLPGKLWDDLARKLEALELARGMDDQQKTIRRGSSLTPAEGIKLFEDGTKIGLHDASYSETFRGNWAHNLKRYLVGELDIESFYESFQK
jgi:hypothetical protein